MPQFAANLSWLYGELPFLDRFAAAAEDGFRAVECTFPYAWPAVEIAARLRDLGLRQVLLNAPAGGADTTAMAAAWDAGARGTAAIKGREAEFQAGLRAALAYAEALDCPRIHVMAGVLPAGCAASEARALYLRHLRMAARDAGAAGRSVTIEPINPRDVPGYLLQRQDDAHSVVADIGSSHLQVQMDLYHCQVVEGDVEHLLRRYLPTGSVGHLQIAGVPARQEPDVGELNYPLIFDAIDAVAAATGWHGWIGCEYRPRAGAVPGGTRAGLGWLRPWM